MGGCVAGDPGRVAAEPGAAGGGGWRVVHRERASRAEVNALALRGRLLLSADGEGRVRAWRLDGLGSSQPFVFRLRVLHEPPQRAAEAEAGVMCLAMPPPEEHARGDGDLARGDGDLARGDGSENRARWRRDGAPSDPSWAVCGGMDGCAHVLAVSGATQLQTIRLASRPDVGWVMAVALGYAAGGAAGGDALLLAGSYEGSACLYQAQRLAGAERPAHEHPATPAFPHEPFALVRRMQVGRFP